MNWAPRGNGKNVYNYKMCRYAYYLRQICVFINVGWLNNLIN